MRSILMLRSVRGIAEGFGTPRELTHVGTFPSVTSFMRLQILQT